MHSDGEGFGTTFTLTLPSQPSTIADTAPSATAVARNMNEEFSSRTHTNREGDLISGKLAVIDEVSPIVPSRSASMPPFPILSMTDDNEDEDAVSQITDVDSPLSEEMLSSNRSTRSHTRIAALSIPNSRQRMKPAVATGSVSVVSPFLYSVLIVDDSGPTRRMVARRLTPLGFEVTQANDGLECLELCGRTITYDVILMDDAMPKLTGPEAVTALRAQGYSGLIIGVTGSADSNTFSKFKLSGANEVLTKPLDVDKFQHIFTQQRTSK